MADEVLEKVGGYVSKLVFNNGESIDIKQDDIVLFVGPNNAGKSQSLKDIYALSLSGENVLLFPLPNLVSIQEVLLSY